jgi:hypothetical protein
MMGHKLTPPNALGLPGGELTFRAQRALDVFPFRCRRL